MFGTQTRVFSICVAVLLFATMAYCQDCIAFSGDFTEIRPNMPNANITGTLYYYRCGSNPNTHRLRMDYKVAGRTFTNVYHYPRNALYSFCTQCKAKKIGQILDPWYNDDKTYNRRNQENNMVWYERKEITDSAQVRKVLCSPNRDAQFKLGQVEFVDGRKIIMNSFKIEWNMNENSNEFKLKDDCKDPTCKIYADIVFVLDDSNSVNTDEWEQQAEFAIKMMGEFEFGDDGVAAAVLKFGGKEADPMPPFGDNNCDRITVDPKYNRGNIVIPSDNTAKVIAPTSSQTFSTDVENLIKVLRPNPRYNPQANPQWTCQGFGLELAGKLFDSSSRNVKNEWGQVVSHPNRIVIAVTDGYEQCPQRTREWASKIRNEYGASLFEVGVGLQKNCDVRGGKSYDQRYLEDIASSFDNSPAYYSVDGYSYIYQLVSNLPKQMCEQFVDDNTECAGNCNGFCACSNCYCPNCLPSGSSCFNYACDRGEAGCTARDNKPCAADNVCVRHVCDGNKPEDQHCSEQVRDGSHCEASMRSKYPGQCVSFTCDVAYANADGCKPVFNHDQCKYLEQNKQCKKYECQAEGCVVSKDEVAAAQQTLVASGESACKEAYCDDGKVRIRDKCPASAKPYCYSNTCTKTGDKKYECVEVETIADRIKENNDKCTTYTCSTEQQKWITVKKGFDECKKEYENAGGEDSQCFTYSCNSNSGQCNSPVQIQGCNPECSQADVNSCLAGGYERSTPNKCVMGVCIKNVGSGHDCDFDSTYTDCTKTMVEAIKDKIATEGGCYTPVCKSGGKCGMEAVPVPADMPEDTACMKRQCFPKEDGSGAWEWRYVSAVTCANNDCRTMKCDPVQGCVEDEDICSSRSNGCWSMYCDEVTLECKNETKLKTTFCMHEVCVNDNPQWVYDLKPCSDNNTNKCLTPVCELSGNEGESSHCSYVEKVCTNCDPCLNNSCIPETGEFNETFRCNDHKACTEDHCSVDGMCWHTDIRCADEISMEGYPCFEPRCIEGKDNYTCKRKLIIGAYIDVCGNCITEDLTSVASSSVDILSCTNAPPKPVLTEGLAAASIALIILAAILVGAAITVSGVFGAKELINRAGGAKDQVAHTNPLFEGNETEMTNPTYDGQTM